MSYALIEDIAASWEEYEPIARSLGPAPDGLLLHVAGPTDEGIRIIEVWDSESAWRRFRDGPAMSRTAHATASTWRARPVFRDLHVAHVVMGGWGCVTEPGPDAATKAVTLVGAGRKQVE